MDDREPVARMKEWGLSDLQAKVYLAMGATDGGSKVRQIAELAEVNRAETYKVLSELEALGLVEMMLGRPKLYRLRDPREVLPSLLTERKKELQGLEHQVEKTAQWILSRQKIDSHQRTNRSSDASTIVLGGSREAILNRVSDEWKQAESEIISVIGKENLMLMFEPFFKNIVVDLHRRGVSFKIMTEITSETSKDVELVQELAEVKHSSVDLEFDIIDGTELILLLSKKGVLSREPLLLTTRDHAFVDTMSGLFYKLWDQAMPANMMVAAAPGGATDHYGKLGQITDFTSTSFAQLVATEVIRLLVGRPPRELHEVMSGASIAWLSKIGEEHFTTLDDFCAAHESGDTNLSRLEGRSSSLGKGFFAIRKCPCPVEIRATADNETTAAICEIHRELVRGYANKVTIGSRRLKALLSPRPDGVVWEFDAEDEQSDTKLRRLKQLSQCYGCVAAFV